MRPHDAFRWCSFDAALALLTWENNRRALEVTAWEPGRGLVHTFHLAQDPAHPSEVAVELVPDEGGCVVQFAHGGWTAESNVSERKKFGDWPILLDRFAALAEPSG